MLHVLGPFRREGGIERDFLAAHAATGARFIGVHGGVPPLVDEADEGRRRHRPGEQETLHRVATRLPQPRKAVGCFHTLGYHLHCRFQKTAALNVRSRLHYSSGGVGSIRQRRAAAGTISGRREDFPQPAVRCGTDGLRAGVVNPPGLTCAALPLTSEGRQRIKR